jgi:transposase
MIPVSPGVRVWLARGHTDMRKGFDGLALMVQETLKRDPHDGHLFVFRGRRGDLIKCLWHDGQGLCLFSKRLERGRFLWPSTADGTSLPFLAFWQRSEDHGRVRLPASATLSAGQALRKAP